MSQVFELLHRFSAHSFKLLRLLPVGRQPASPCGVPPEVVGEFVDGVEELHGGDADRGSVGVEARRRAVVLVDERGEAVEH